MKKYNKIVLLFVIITPLIMVNFFFVFMGLSVGNNQSKLWKLYDRLFILNYSNSIPVLSTEVFISSGSGHTCKYVVRWFFYSSDELLTIQKFFEDHKTVSPITKEPISVEITKINLPSSQTEPYFIYYKDGIKHQVKDDFDVSSKEITFDNYYSATVINYDEKDSFLDPRCN